MKTLLLMRHAKSSWKKPERADHDRPLNKRGKRDAPRMGRFLRENGLLPDVVLSSTAVRARKTAAKVVQASGCDAIVELRAEIYGADPHECVDVLNDQYHDAPCVLFIGHNPCLEELLESLTRCSERLSTGAVAQICLPVSSWRSLTLQTQGTLVDIWRPRELE